MSFFLVQHWVFRLATLKAGLKVFTYSQVGDLPFFLACFLLLARAGTSDLSEILPMFPLWNFDYVACGGVLLHFNTVFLSLLLFALFLKAAQFFFYPWLLDAMEAPVPISAQLHSSTLVIIGFYLVARFQLPLQTTPSVRWLFLGVGFVTVVGASCLAFMQSDGKRLLACSTASQLGYVIVALGLQLYAEAYALLTFCCCNKAATFI